MRPTPRWVAAGAVCCFQYALPTPLTLAARKAVAVALAVGPESAGAAERKGKAKADKHTRVYERGEESANVL